MEQFGLAWFTAGSLVSGWIVARAQPKHWAGPVVLFLATYFVIQLCLVGWMAVLVHRDPHVYTFSERTYLIAALTRRFVMWPACIMLGALIQARRADEPYMA